MWKINAYIHIYPKGLHVTCSPFNCIFAFHIIDLELFKVLKRVPFSKFSTEKLHILIQHAILNYFMN